jgi:DNA-binding GntR family transcriptional regulator
VGRNTKYTEGRRIDNKPFFSDKAYSMLKKMMLEMTFSPKEPLSESKLALMAGMSRTPVREALKRLKNEHIVISSDKRGYFLNIPTAKEIKDLYEVRAILEGAAARLAARYLDPARLDDFEKDFLSFRDESNGPHQTGKDFVKLGREFHFFIIENTMNQKLKELIESIYDQIALSRIYSYGQRREEIIDEHLRIIRALRDKDEEKSQKVMEEHIQNLFQMLLKTL